MSDRRLAWDTDIGAVNEPKKTAEAPPQGDGIVRVRRETGGRNGKTVTTITGMPFDTAELKSLLKQLKKKCGVGGAVRDFVIELQGDQRAVVVPELEGRGFTVKLAGG